MNKYQIFTKLKEINDLIKISGLARPASNIPLCQVCEQIILSPDITKKCLKLYKDGHYALAVETAYKLINNYVKRKSGLNSIDGMSLMQTALSPVKPRIKLNKLQTPSEKDEQLGYMNILAGCMIGIRNPRAHEHDYQDSERTAFELLILADHLIRKLDSA